MIGTRIIKNFKRVDKKYIDMVGKFSAADISDATYKLFSLNAKLKPMGKGNRIVGSAITVKPAIGNNILLHKAIDLANPGDVLVVNSWSDLNYSVCGDIMYKCAINKGLSGFIIDGAVRDIDFLKNNDFPVYALGSTPMGSYRNAVGEINTDISCGGQVIHPGDIIVADDDGIVVLPKEDVINVIEKIQKVYSIESSIDKDICGDNWSESRFMIKINNALKDNNFEIIEQMNN